MKKDKKVWAKPLKDLIDYLDRIEIPDYQQIVIADLVMKFGRSCVRDFTRQVKGNIRNYDKKHFDSIL